METHDEMILRQRRAGWFVRSPTASPQGAAVRSPGSDNSAAGERRSSAGADQQARQRLFSEARAANESHAPDIAAAMRSLVEMVDGSEAAELPSGNNSSERPPPDSTRGTHGVDDDMPPGAGLARPTRMTAIPTTPEHDAALNATFNDPFFQRRNPPNPEP